MLPPSLVYRKLVEFSRVAAQGHIGIFNLLLLCRWCLYYADQTQGGIKVPFFLSAPLASFVLYVRIS